MPGEVITATTLTDAKEELRNIYKAKSNKFKGITFEEYEDLEYDERSDSDNHLNEEKLKNEKVTVTDFAYYKYLPDRQIAYRIVLKHKDGSEMEDFFITTPDFA